MCVLVAWVDASWYEDTVCVSCTHKLSACGLGARRRPDPSFDWLEDTLCVD